MLAHVSTANAPEGYFYIWLYKYPNSRHEERYYRAFFSMNEREYAAQFLRDNKVRFIEFSNSMSERDRQFLGWFERVVQQLTGGA